MGTSFRIASVVPLLLAALASPRATPRAAADVVFFDEEFNGPALDSSCWRTEILTSGVRWCDQYAGSWDRVGTWVEEGEACYGVPAYAPYGTAELSGGLLHLSSTNPRAFPVLVSRYPGPVPLFPPTGDFTVNIGMRYDRITVWGTYLMLFDTESTEPIGTQPLGSNNKVLLGIAGNGGTGWRLYSALDGSSGSIGDVPLGFQFRDFELECVGNSFTVRVDGEVFYGPVTSSLRPTAMFMGNPIVAYWTPVTWCWFTMDYIRVRVPGPVPVATSSWSRVKDLYRGGGR